MLSTNMSTLATKRPASIAAEESSASAKKRKLGVNSSSSAEAYAVQVTRIGNAEPQSCDELDSPETRDPVSARPREESTHSPPPAASDKKRSKPKAAPIETLFEPYDHSLPPLPKFNARWGRKPMPGPDGPQPRSNSPPARTSNAQTNPPLWEDRKFRYKKSGRFVQSFRKGEIVDDAAPELDQQENLVLKLIDMRPKSRKDPTPRRLPYYYVYGNGIPKDWTSRQAIKALNDRRQQAIDRITADAPWTNFERNHLASLVQDYPDASITELTERFNWRFKDADFAKSTAFEWDYISTGRTIESVRAEYLTYKHKYDVGETPARKELIDRSTGAKSSIKNRMSKFGKMDKDLAHDDSDDDNDDDDDDDDVETDSHEEPPAKSRKRKSASMDDVGTKRRKIVTVGSEVGVETSSSQSQSSKGDEELLELAGYNQPGEPHKASPLS